MRRLWGRRWHTVLVAPRDPLDSIKTECGLPMELPVLLESYPMGDDHCDKCVTIRLLAEVEASDAAVVEPDWFRLP